MALVLRIALLLSITILLKLTQPIFYLSHVVPRQWLAENVDHVSIKDLILLIGGLFLISKSVREIHHKFEGGGDELSSGRTTGFAAVLFQIALMDVIFSL